MNISFCFPHPGNLGAAIPPARAQHHARGRAGDDSGGASGPLGPAGPTCAPRLVNGTPRLPQRAESASGCTCSSPRTETPPPPPLALFENRTSALLPTDRYSPRSVNLLPPPGGFRAAGDAAFAAADPRAHPRVAAGGLLSKPWVAAIYAMAYYTPGVLELFEALVRRARAAIRLWAAVVAHTRTCARARAALFFRVSHLTTPANLAWLWRGPGSGLARLCFGSGFGSGVPGEPSQVRPDVSPLDAPRPDARPGSYLQVTRCDSRPCVDRAHEPRLLSPVIAAGGAARVLLRPRPWGGGAAPLVIADQPFFLGVLMGCCIVFRVDSAMTPRCLGPAALKAAARERCPIAPPPPPHSAAAGPPLRRAGEAGHRLGGGAARSPPARRRRQRRGNALRGHRPSRRHCPGSAPLALSPFCPMALPL